jgi:transcriptional regulator with GAF, ATPase, and Fis domain
MPAKLVVLAGPLCGEAFPLDGARMTIGRDAASQLSIPDSLVSRRHCAIEAIDGRFVLTDLGSANGSFVNGIPLGQRHLEHGDRIRVGDSVLLFLQPADDGAAAAVEQQGSNEIRTERVLPDARGHPPDHLTAPEWIAAEVLAGRVALQAHEMVGDTPSMRAVYERIRKVALADCTVLVSGETGTGKELVARAIHENSRRARRPFVTVNCAALTESLLESELFGHEKGAFTGAVSLNKGKMEVADGGTLFLDEIGELAPALQVKFLRALQHHAFERVGGTRTIAVNVRVIAASNQDLEGAVESGRFRQDLWYRLNVVTITMPPLRDRRADVPRLAKHFAAKHGRGRALTFSVDALEALTTYDWPGNVRELENAVQRAIVLGCSDQIELGDLPDAIVESSEVTGESPSRYHQNVLETKRRLILDAIDRCGGNCTAAARLLGINPTYLHRLLTNLQLRGMAGIRRE